MCCAQVRNVYAGFGVPIGGFLVALPLTLAAAAIRDLSGAIKYVGQVVTGLLG
jgi:hypothetical protein